MAMRMIIRASIIPMSDAHGCSHAARHRFARSQSHDRSGYWSQLFKLGFSCSRSWSDSRNFGRNEGWQ